MDVISNFFLVPSSLTEQNEIVATLIKLEYQTNKLGETYTNKLQSLDKLKKFILKKAFTSEFTKKEVM